MAIRSGLRTFGAQHIVSLTKTSAEVKRIVGTYDALAIAKQDTEEWLSKASMGETTVDQVVTDILKAQEEDVGAGVEVRRKYSIAQLCELHEHKKVCALMNHEERIHIEAHSGPSHAWVTQFPLSFKSYNMTSAVWRTSVLKRLRQDVMRVERQCTFCKWSRGDRKGEHAIMCAGGCSRILRHNTTRDVIAKAIRDIGYRTDIEHGGGLGDQRRPGDVIVYNWSGDKRLLIDVAVINPLSVSHSNSLIEKGVGESATAYENIKRSTYSDIDSSRYEYVPFVLESCGGVGQATLKLCKDLQERREAKEYWENKNIGAGIRDVTRFPNPLLTAINIEVQRFNSKMILERQPHQIDLIEPAFMKCKAEVARKKIEASKSLQRISYRGVILDDDNAVAAYMGPIASSNEEQVVI